MASLLNENICSVCFHSFSDPALFKMGSPVSVEHILDPLLPKPEDHRCHELCLSYFTAQCIKDGLGLICPRCSHRFVPLDSKKIPSEFPESMADLADMAIALRRGSEVIEALKRRDQMRVKELLSQGSVA